jgi:peroxiredoxin
MKSSNDVFYRVVKRMAAMLMVCAIAACTETINKPLAPPVSFVTEAHGNIASSAFDMKSLAGKVVLINFWATSCTTCVAEMPTLIDTHQRYAAQGYRTIAVAVNYDPIDYVHNFATSRALPFDVVHDTDDRLSQAFGDIRLTPTSFLIDKQGRIAKRYIGDVKPTELHEAVERLLAQKT